MDLSPASIQVDLQPYLLRLQSLVQQHFRTHDTSSPTSFETALADAKRIWSQCIELDLRSSLGDTVAVPREGVKEGVLRLMREETAAVVVSRHRSAAEGYAGADPLLPS